MSQQVGAAPAPHTPVICEENAQLECGFREAEDTFRPLELLSGKSLLDRPGPSI
jgi:hypothetical protein